MIVSELLKDNLYDFYKYLTDNNNTEYFTVERIQKLTKQILIRISENYLMNTEKKNPV